MWLPMIDAGIRKKYKAISLPFRGGKRSTRNLTPDNVEHVFITQFAMSARYTFVLFSCTLNEY